jgi:TonB family protein
METLERSRIASIKTEPEIHLLLEQDRAGDWSRWRMAAVVSLVAHVAFLSWISTTHFEERPPLRPEQVFTPLLTRLYTPQDITQKAPNKSPISKELSVEAIAPRPLVKAPAPAPAAKQPAPTRQFSPPPPVETARNAPKPQMTEPPKIQGPAAPDQNNQIERLSQLPPLPAQNENPKLTLEEAGQTPNNTSGKNPGLLQMPGSTVQDAIRNLTRPGAPGAQSVGDIGADEGGSGPGLNLPPSAGRPLSRMELKSDPMGVDFHPYMLQVLLAIRRNWFAVYPEAARLGLRGEVSLMFGIARQGGVTKIVFISETPSKPLNEAAVAAISASNPLPPLPSQFKGDRIVLQMKFLYNMPR